MTNLADLARDLSLGHLSDLPAYGEGLGIIEPTRVPSFLVRVNDALRAVYMRFPLQTRTIIIEAIDGIHLYPLRTEYALTSGSAEVNKFIKDSVAEPFLGDVLGIEHVYDGDQCELPLNDRKDCLSLNTPSFDVLELAKPVTGERYSIEYRAAHAPVAVDLVDLTGVTLRIPAALMSAFKLHIAAGLHEGGGSEGLITKSAAYLMAYESECVRLEAANTLNQSLVETNLKSELRGWP